MTEEGDDEEKEKEEACELGSELEEVKDEMSTGGCCTRRACNMLSQKKIGKKTLAHSLLCAQFCYTNLGGTHSIDHARC